MIKLADGRGSLYQWDTGRQVECDAEQVHFSNHHYGTSIDVNVQNGKATIPNQLLTSATPLKAWAWVTDSNGEYTKEEQIFIVAKRNKPSDYVYTPAEIKTWQDLQNQIDILAPKAHTHANKSVLDKFAETDGKPTYDGEVLGGGEKEIFKIPVTITALEEPAGGESFKVEHTVTLAELDAAVKEGKIPIVLASFEGLTYDLPLLYYYSGAYLFYTTVDGRSMSIIVGWAGDEGNTPKESWQFMLTGIAAESVSYSNDALPNVTDVRGALDELVPNSHTHANKDTLDKLSDANGKLQYNGSDVGLKGDKGDKGDPGSDANVTKANVIAALGYTPEAVSAQVTTGTEITLADNTEYRLTDVTTLNLTYPTSDFECWMRLTFSASGNATVTLPTGTKYIGTTPDFKKGETWEMSIKDGVVIAQKVGDGT